MKETKDKKTKRMELRLRENEKTLIENKAKLYGMTNAQYILGLVNKDNNGNSNIHNLPLNRILIQMTEILYNELPEITDDQELIAHSRKVVDELWHYLKRNRRLSPMHLWIWMP